MKELGLLKHVVPRAEAELIGFNAAIWTLSLTTLGAVDGPRWPEPGPVSFPLALATLLHRIGKRLVGIECRRLKLSNAESERIAWLVDKQQYLRDAPTMRLSKLKPILVHPGIGELLALHRAIAIASAQSLEHVEYCERMLRETPSEELNPPPLLTGDDLLALGWKQGPLFKKVLDAIREGQLEGELRSRDDAIRLAESSKDK